MKILFVVMYNKTGVLDWEHDYRFNTLYNLFKSINDKHEIYYHIIYINKEDEERISSLLQIFKLFPIENNDKNIKRVLFDVSLCWIGIKMVRKNIYKFIKESSKEIVFYDHGPFKHSTFIDNIGWCPPHLPSYTNTINELSEKNYDEHKCSLYIDNYLSNNFSKRIQSDKIDISNTLFNNYIFIPTQKHDDLLFKNKKNISMFSFIEKIIIFSKKENIPVVIKIHPHIRQLRQIQKIKIENMIKKHKNTNVYFSNASINFLIKNARFTAILNGYLVMDNFLNQCPVLMILPNPFMFTSAIVYDENIENGLKKMINEDYDRDKMRLKQKKIVWWFLKQNVLFETNSIKDNIRIINNYLENKII